MTSSAASRIVATVALFMALSGVARAADTAGSVSTALGALPWQKARALSVAVLVQGREPLGEADAALVAQVRADLAAAAKARRPRVQLDLTGPAAGRARFARLLELNLVPVGAPDDPGLVTVDATFFDLTRRPSGGYDVATRAVHPVSDGALRVRFDVLASPAAARLADRPAALLAHEQALRARAAERKERTRALVANGEFSEIAVGSKELLGLPVARVRLEGLFQRAYAGSLGAFAAIFAESAYNVRNRFIDAVDRIAEGELGSIPDWYDGQPPAGSRRLRATDETIEERPYYQTEGPRWAPYWDVVGPRREAVLAAFEQFLEDGGLLVMEDEHCAEEPLAGLLPASCEEIDDPVRVDLRPADGSARPERVTLRSPLWSALAGVSPEAPCQPLVVASDRRRWPQPFAVRCDRPEGGVVVYTSFHADDLARGGALEHALYGGGEQPGALEAALLDAPYSGPALQALRPDSSIATPVVVDRAAVTLAASSEPIASTSGGAPATARASFGIYVDSGEHGYVQVAFKGGPVRAELRSASGALVAVRAADTPPLLVDLMRRPRGLYELRLIGEQAGTLATVQHLSTVPRQRWTGATIAAWGAQAEDAIVVDGFVRGTVGIPAGAVARLRAEGATLLRLATTTPAAAASAPTVVIEGHASQEGSARANLILSTRRAMWAAGVVTSAAEVSAGAACTVPASGETCASWLGRMGRRAGRADAAAGVTADLAIGGSRVRVAVRPQGASTPVAACERRDEACHLQNRRVLLRLQR